MAVTKEEYKAKVLEVVATREAFCTRVEELKEMRKAVGSTGHIDELEAMRYKGDMDLRKAVDTIEQLAMNNK